jgi:hypothetical protein
METPLPEGHKRMDFLFAPTFNVSKMYILIFGNFRIKEEIDTNIFIYTLSVIIRAVMKNRTRKCV